MINTFVNGFSESLKEKVKENVRSAFEKEEMRSRQFGRSVDPADQLDEERPQPTIFQGKLKHYQLKGMNWLATLYDQVCVCQFIIIKHLLIVEHILLRHSTRHNLSYNST